MDLPVPVLRLESTGQSFPLTDEVTTVGRGSGVDVPIADPSVSRLHAELVRRGPHVYVADLGLSTNGTRVNGRPVARQVLREGDVIGFGATRARISGLAEDNASDDGPDATVALGNATAPQLTRRETEVLEVLCRPALRQDAFVEPATAREVAATLVVTEAAVKQHLLRLYQKFRIEEGPGRRGRLANEVIARGIVRPLPDQAVHQVRRAG